MGAYCEGLVCQDKEFWFCLGVREHPRMFSKLGREPRSSFPSFCPSVCMVGSGPQRSSCGEGAAGRPAPCPRHCAKFSSRATVAGLERTLWQHPSTTDFQIFEGSLVFFIKAYIGGPVKSQPPSPTRAVSKGQ